MKKQWELRLVNKKDRTEKTIGICRTWKQADDMAKKIVFGSEFFLYVQPVEEKED